MTIGITGRELWLSWPCILVRYVKNVKGIVQRRDIRREVKYVIFISRISESASQGGAVYVDQLASSVNKG